MRSRIEFAQWSAKQVLDLRRLGFQVADKSIARVLVELHNRGGFDAGLMLVGTLGYMAWLNELGARSIVARTQDVDLARRQPLRLAEPMPFLRTVRRTRLPFTPVPGLPSHRPPTSVKLPGADGLRIDLLAPGRRLGDSVPIPELQWQAQAIPYYDWLLEGPEPAASLAGGHCVPIRLPRAERWVWHKLYSSTSRNAFAEKSAKDVLQACTLAAIIIEQGTGSFDEKAHAVPAAVRSAAKRRLPLIRRVLAAHVQTLEEVESMVR